jgi:hypothetical protein
MIKTIVCVAALALPASEAICGDWLPAQAPGHPYFVGVQFVHDDNGSLVVVCDTREKLIRIIHTEPRANWKEGDTVGVTTKDDDGVGTGTSRGMVMSSNMVVVMNESTFDLWTMGNAKRFFTVSAGNYARIYPATNFKRATEPALRACVDRWQ